MKKILSMVFIVLIMLSLIGCSKENSNSSLENQTTLINNSNQARVDISNISMYEELEELILNDVKQTVSNLENEQKQLGELITSYNLYLENQDKVENFYSKSIEDTEQLGIRLREYALLYAQFVLETEEKTNAQYEELERIYDCIYEDAGKEMYKIYDEILQNTYNLFYNGVLNNVYNVIGYDNWYDVSSNEYELWLDTMSNIYNIWYKMQSDIYRFTVGIRSKAYSGNSDKIQDEIEEFQKDINKLKNNQNS